MPNLHLRSQPYPLIPPILRIEAVLQLRCVYQFCIYIEGLLVCASILSLSALSFAELPFPQFTMKSERPALGQAVFSVRPH